MTKQFVVFLITLMIASLAIAQSIPAATLIGKVSAEGAAVVMLR